MFWGFGGGQGEVGRRLERGGLDLGGGGPPWPGHLTQISSTLLLPNSRCRMEESYCSWLQSTWRKVANTPLPQGDLWQLPVPIESSSSYFGTPEALGSGNLRTELPENRNSPILSPATSAYAAVPKRCMLHTMGGGLDTMKLCCSYLLVETPPPLPQPHPQFLLLPHPEVPLFLLLPPHSQPFPTTDLPVQKGLGSLWPPGCRHSLFVVTAALRSMTCHIL